MRTKCNRMDLIKNLNLWGNDLQDISVLQGMPNLEVLSLSVNHVTSLADLQHCPKLSELYLRKNEICDLNEIRYLKNLRNMRVLWLSDNPCASLPHYRQYVLHHLPYLTKIDSQDVTDQERQDAIKANFNGYGTRADGDGEIEDSNSNGDETPGGMQVASKVHNSTQLASARDRGELGVWGAEEPAPPAGHHPMYRSGDPWNLRRSTSTPEPAPSARDHESGNSPDSDHRCIGPAPPNCRGYPGNPMVEPQEPPASFRASWNVEAAFQEEDPYQANMARRPLRRDTPEMAPAGDRRPPAMPQRRPSTPEMPSEAEPARFQGDWSPSVPSSRSHYDRNGYHMNGQTPSRTSLHEQSELPRSISGNAEGGPEGYRRPLENGARGSWSLAASPLKAQNARPGLAADLLERQERLAGCHNSAMAQRRRGPSDQSPARNGAWGAPEAVHETAEEHRPGRADNILCAVLALIKELDQQGLELVRRAVEHRSAEL